MYAFLISPYQRVWVFHFVSDPSSTSRRCEKRSVNMMRGGGHVPSFLEAHLWSPHPLFWVSKEKKERKKNAPRASCCKIKRAEWSALHGRFWSRSLQWVSSQRNFFFRCLSGMDGARINWIGFDGVVLEMKSAIRSSSCSVWVGAKNSCSFEHNTQGFLNTFYIYLFILWNKISIKSKICKKKNSFISIKCLLW